MYGTIHKALASAITNEFGAEKWAAAEAEAGVDVSAQFKMDPYKDEQFTALLAAAERHTSASRHALLEAAGRSFAATFSEPGTRDLIADWGDTLPAFLDHFDKKYRRVHDLHPKMAPPSLKVSKITDAGLTVTYRSERDGLEAFAIGILHALAEHFGTPVAITRDPASPRVFQIAYS